MVRSLLVLCTIAFFALSAAKNASNSTPTTEALTVDACLQKRSNSEKSECLQPLLEHFYGKDMFLNCPNLGHILAYENCKGCPWDHIDPERENPPWKFHSAEETCSIANHVRYYSNWGSVHFSRYTIDIVASLLSLVVSLNGINSGRRVWKLPEFIYIALLHVTMNASWILFLRSRDILIYCHSFSDSYSDNGAAVATWAIALFISMSRSFKLESSREVSIRDSRESSWYNFVRDVWHNRTQQKNSDKCLAIIVLLFPAIFLFCFLASFVFSFNRPRWEGYGRCFAGEKDIYTGFIQYSLVLLEIVSASVYALGTSPNPKVRAARNVSFYVLIWFNAILLYLQFTPDYNPVGISELIPRVLNADVDSDFFIEHAHSMLMICWGLLEPLRTEVPILAVEEISDSS